MQGLPRVLAWGWRVDFVGIDVLLDSFLDSRFESLQEVHERFAGAAAQHGQGIVPIGGDGDAADRANDADGYLAVVDQRLDMGEERFVGGSHVSTLRSQAAWRQAGCRIGATFHGSSSSI